MVVRINGAAEDALRCIRLPVEIFMTASIQDQTGIILDSIADGVFTVDSDFRITSFNRAAERITGIQREEAIGRFCWEVFRASICEKRCALKETMETGGPIVNRSLYIVSLKGDRIPVSISTALLKDKQGKVIGGAETFRDLSLLEQLRKELSGRHSLMDIISKNEEMQRLFLLVEQVAGSDATVLLEGESGTGKELFARAIHSLSPRRKKPMITIHCGALPDTLLESELFGYKAGAFTDAKKDKPGRIALAEGGTLFLDEIGDISPALQVRLLRVLQEKTYEPLGSTKSDTSDVRIVAATNKSLETLLQEGKFRRDLYYRINVVKIVIPPLRARKEDIPLLMDHFLQKFNRLEGKEIQGFSPEATAALMVYDFPGNVRELENIVEYATVVCRDSLIRLEHLPDGFRKDRPGDAAEAPAPAASKGASWERVERRFVEESLRQNNWSRTLTAREMGVHPTTLWRKMRRLGIEIPKKSRKH
jgi:PAS domain S-box-containing protein